MKTKVLDEQQGQQTYAVIFDKGDAFMSQLKDFARDQNLVGSHFTAIGAFKDAMLGYFDREKMDYEKIPVNEQVEVLLLVGDIARGPEGEPKVHAHVVLGKANGTALGGHILEAHVWPTLELVVTESPRHMQRRHDEETGLALIDLEV